MARLIESLQRPLLAFLICGTLAAAVNWFARMLLSLWMPFAPAVVIAYVDRHAGGLPALSALCVDRRATARSRPDRRLHRGQYRRGRPRPRHGDRPRGLRRLLVGVQASSKRSPMVWRSPWVLPPIMSPIAKSPSGSDPSVIEPEDARCFTDLAFFSPVRE